MIQEIREQPAALQATLQNEASNVQALADRVRQRNVDFAVIVARGSSDNAAKILKYLLEIMAGLPVALAAPSVVTLYKGRLHFKNALVIGISQSGQAPDVTEYLSAARAGGALTASITNDPSSPLANAAESHLALHCGPELSVAATKTYTCTLALAFLLAKALSNDGAEAALIPDLATKTLLLEPVIQPLVERYRYMRECAVLARGINLGTADEVALKLMETTYSPAKPFSIADFMHGPFALIEDAYPCLLLAPNGAALQSMVDGAAKLKSGGAELIVAAANKDILSLARSPIPIDFQVDESLSPIVYAIVGQLFAYYLAVSRDLNPDQPRGLTKVTKTN